jgi:hypothetical protein
MWSIFSVYHQNAEQVFWAKMNQIHALNHQKGWRKGTNGQSFYESLLKVGEKLIKQTKGSNTHCVCLTGGRGQTAPAIILEVMEAQQWPQQVYKSTHLEFMWLWKRMRFS